MKQKEDFYREIDIFSKGASGFSPFIVDIMRGIEREFGGIEKEYLDYISEKFGVKVEEVLDTAKMLGMKLNTKQETLEIRVCLGMHCKANGGEFVLDEFKRLLKIDIDETTTDGKFSLAVQRCFAKCTVGPNVKVGEKFYNRVDVEDVKKIIEENK